MSYNEFLATHIVNPKDTALKVDTKEKTDVLKEDISIPSFYNIGVLDHISLFQGSHFAEKPHYESSEQIMCAIEGGLSIALIAHIFRQELYTQNSFVLSHSVFKDPTLTDH